jgi:hypothetical protein
MNFAIPQHPQLPADMTLRTLVVDRTASTGAFAEHLRLVRFLEKHYPENRPVRTQPAELMAWPEHPIYSKKG